MDVNLEQYIIAIKAKLSSSQIISFIEIIDERILRVCQENCVKAQFIEANAPQT